ncbi:MAG: shikimate kinase, partial [Clostridia bacterium]|nr:shikimate kinase [Clostridia bacterium]
IDDGVIDDIERALSFEMQNVVLVGMPGCGKSTLAHMLAEALGRDCLESDAEVERAAGKSIPAIFAEDGEDVFRDLESECIAKAGAKNGVILSLGGGAVTRERNYLPLHQNGRIYCLKRDLPLLATDGRPLSKDLETLKAMEAVRAPLYERFADVTVVNDGTLEDAAEAILKDFTNLTS